MAQIPSPIVVGQQRQPFAQQLIMALLSQAPDALMSFLNQRRLSQAQNAPPQPTYAQEAEGRSALDFLFQQPPGQSRIVEGLKREPGLGDARKDFGPALKRAQQVAPAEAKQIATQQEEVKKAAEKALAEAQIKAQARAIADGISGITPDQKDQVTRLLEFKGQFPDALPAESFTAMLTQMLPPGKADEALIRVREQDIIESKARVGKIAIDIKQGKDRQAAVAQLAQEAGIDWYSPGLEDEVLKFYTESRENPVVARQRFALAMAGIVRQDFLGNPIAFVTGSEAVQIADNLARQLDPAGGASLPALDPTVIQETEFVAQARPRIQEVMQGEKPDIVALRNDIIERAVAFGLSRERAAQLFVEIIRTIPSF